MKEFWNAIKKVVAKPEPPIIPTEEEARQDRINLEQDAYERGDWGHVLPEDDIKKTMRDLADETRKQNPET